MIIKGGFNMISKELLEALNEQYNFEMESAYIYVGMAADCSEKGMNGFAHFFNQQAREEYSHAVKFYDFIYEMDGRVNLTGMEKPRNEYDSYLEAFETALLHEKEVTRRINNLMAMAHDEKSFTTVQFLQWFIEEQREEENNFKDIIFNLKGIGQDFQGLYLLDKELATRPNFSMDAATQEG